jgi:hypothetical protein
LERAFIHEFEGLVDKKEINVNLSLLNSFRRVLFFKIVDRIILRECPRQGANDDEENAKGSIKSNYKW